MKVESGPDINIFNVVPFSFDTIEILMLYFNFDQRILEEKSDLRLIDGFGFDLFRIRNWIQPF